MFEKIGRKLACGAKAEIIDKTGMDWNKVLKIITAVAETGLFVIAFALDRKSQKPQTTTMIVNNYITKGD